jgi:AcrR family transcriptional regulator
MGRALFDNAGFLAAARALACERGPGAVTVDSITQRLKAPKGSFYHRFPSRDALLGELWLKTVLAYQEGFVAAIEAGDGLAAALHTPAWARLHLDDARLLLLYSRHDFVQGDWPAALKRGVRDQARRFEACLASFARQAFGRAGPTELQCTAFVLAAVPLAAMKPHLERREPPPALVDELITATYNAIVHGGARSNAGAEASKRPDARGGATSPSIRSRILPGRA